MLRVSHVSKRYGKVTAVSDWSLEVNPGENVGLLGPNGAGKTTALRMIVGMLRPDQGDVSLDGIDLWRQPLAAKALLAYIPDVPYLFPRMTGWEHVSFVARAFGLSPEDCAAQISDLVDLFGLTPYIHRPVEEYSHGMRQKVAWVAALLHRPRYVILDEPTVGLDPQNIRLIKDVLQHITASGTGVLMSTHSMEMAEQLADRLVVVSKARMVATGTLAEFRAQATEAAATLETLFLRFTGGVATAEALKRALGEVRT